jgi:hypothetical protein
MFLSDLRVIARCLPLAPSDRVCTPDAAEPGADNASRKRKCRNTHAIQLNYALLLHPDACASFASFLL